MLRILWLAAMNQSLLGSLRGAPKGGRKRTMRAVRQRDWLDGRYRLTPEGRAVLDQWGDQ